MDLHLGLVFHQCGRGVGVGFMTFGCQHNSNITCVYSDFMVFDSVVLLLNVVSVVHVVARACYVRIVGKPRSPRTCYRSLASSCNTAETTPAVWPISLAGGRNHGQNSKTEIWATRPGTSYTSDCYAPKLNVVFFPHFRAQATTKPAIGMCLKPQACTGAVTVL